MLLLCALCVGLSVSLASLLYLVFPRPPTIPVPKIVKSLLSGLRNSDFEGDIHHDYATRLVSATDNSIYQVLPQAVIFPKNSSDIKKLLKISNEKRFRNIIKITPRGGGTGTNGQSLTEGIVLDCSRYMNKILETNLNEGWVLVESGVVLDQLNEHLAPLNMFFAPDLSPSHGIASGIFDNSAAPREPGSR